MLLIHLSDIHFRSGQAGSPFDPDQMIRSRLIDDVRTHCERLGERASAVLISGDIGYAGKRDEYDFATKWLQDLAAACGTSLANVFTCPGNHDVDREVARGAAIRLLHQAIKQQQPLARDAAVAGLLSEADNSDLLFKPIRNYNSFAQQLFCALTPPNDTVAKRALRLNDGSTLRLWGLNSALISSEEDAKEQLAVDPAFNQIVRVAGEENLVICHHPPNWIMGGNALGGHLDAVARIQLFGHEHDSRLQLERRYVRIFAGAAQPARDEANWEPGYNIIQLKVIGANADRRLAFSIRARVWQRNPDQFRPKMDGESDVFEHSIALEPWVSSAPPQQLRQESSECIVPISQPTSVVDPMDSVREIGVRFFRLTLSQRAAIAGKLNLLEQEDEYKPDVERYREVFRRAQQRNLVRELDEAVRTEELGK